MTWKKYFTPVEDSSLSPVSGRNSNSRIGPARSNYSSYLPDIYTGSPNRVERYAQYEVMDSDPEINAALDILAEFCTDRPKGSKSALTAKWRSSASNSEVRILGEYLQQWNKLQEFDTRIMRIVRNVFKYGDVFFIRDPETQKWSWVDPSKIVKIIVNESDGKKPEQYIIKDLAPNFEHLVATQITPNINPRQNGGGVIPSSGYLGANATQRGASGPYPTSSSGSRWGLSETEHAINAEHMVHLSLSEGMDNNFPFGNSLLENIFKVYKQKELLEDAILIYRIQRAPERRIFHIDVGNMPSHLAMAFVERVKNEIHQRRIPSQTGGGCFSMDTKIPLLDGRVLPISELANEYENGIENWAFSCDPMSREMVPGLITWAGVTQKSAKVIEIILDNGEKIVCTPEHKFPIIGKGKIEAKDIKVNEDSLISFNTRLFSINEKENSNDPQYHQYYEHTSNKWTFTHRKVAKFFKNSEKHNELVYSPWMQFLKDQGKHKSQPVRKLKWDLSMLKILIDEVNANEIIYKNDAYLLISKNQDFLNIFKNINQGIKGNSNINNFSKNTFTVFLQDMGYKTWKDFNNYKNEFNHKVVSMREIDEPIEVGTLTIDGNEIWHNYHTFAIEQGVFTYNSNVIDSAYNPMCLDLSTEIPLLDGRTLPLQEIITEFEQGKENWIYSCDPETGEIMPGVIDWAGITRKDTETIKITFDNGEILICTPDHKIPVLGKGFVEAKDLTTHDSLIAFNIRNTKISRGKTNEYQQVWDHKSKSWIWTHRMVGEFFRKQEKHQEFTYLPENIGEVKSTIHHKDCDRFNNDPRNITYMNKADHILYHSSMKKEFWENMTDEYRTEMTAKIANTVRANWAKLSEHEKQVALYRLSEARGKAAWMRKNDEETRIRYKKNYGISRRKAIENTPTLKNQLIKNLTNKGIIHNQEIIYTQEMLGIVVNIVKTTSKNKNKVLEVCDSNAELLDIFQLVNPNKDGFINKINYSKWGYSKMDDMLIHFGYKNWKDFVRKVDQYNHKIKTIEKVSNRDTGTITVDGRERWHSHHTFAIASGIFIKNSISEDYFFPMTADGRGSKVDTLAGGSNLGEIDDLKYFTNKLFRALRIPSSYLPTGADDSSSQFNDGRVGTAYIQELRFNKYCERLQMLITSVFDEEFKLYMNSRGVNIDSSLFDLHFNPPLNFSTYRQAEMDTPRIQSFNTVQQIPFISNRFALKRYLGWTEDEVAENERLWGEESGQGQPTHTDAAGEMRSAGLSAAGISGDLGMAGDLSIPTEMEGVVPADGDLAAQPPQNAPNPGVMPT